MKNTRIHDYEVPFHISEYENAFEINDTALFLARYDSKIVIALSECLVNLQEVVWLLEYGEYSVFST
ncbi:hypothetical protein [Brevibacillus brevis]|uniref:hypothetical protein n=1 Tax=Brevibacillus brevis TaxID=1393 RepID=UPI001EDA294C|nr:hypothetical protein [Brevibacillus brevis]